MEDKPTRLNPLNDFAFKKILGEKGEAKQCGASPRLFVIYTRPEVSVNRAPPMPQNRKKLDRSEARARSKVKFQPTVTVSARAMPTFGSYCKEGWIIDGGTTRKGCPR
jgi:hypothetical protein